MAADLSLGAGFSNLMGAFNIAGTGADMILMGIAMIIAVGITFNEIKDQKYTNTMGIFMMSGAVFFGTGIMVSWMTFGALCIIGVIGIIISESTKTYRA